MKSFLVRAEEQPSNRIGGAPTIGAPLLFCRLVNTALFIALVVVVFLAPVAMVIHDLTDKNIRQGGTPRAAWKLYQALTPKYAKWARERAASSRATELSTSDIAGTEWPLFGTVFYLLALESLQDAWDTNRSVTSVAPNVFARDAIDAAAELVIDPQQASWVKKHWGENYLKQENAFYRMLLIAALSSHARLTGDRQHLPFLREQVESLSAEIDRSPYGLLEDYPGECYPGDVLMAIALIRKADRVLGTDHTAFAARAIRGFEKERLDSVGLVPYAARASHGKPLGTSRGCGNSYASLFGPYLWPEPARRWYDLYTQHFWQEGTFAAGFREFPKQAPRGDWYFDVDSGPVFSGFGLAACAFGTGAARANGHFEHAFPLTAELYFTSWPLPGRTLLLPRLLSNAADAPYLGEAAILFVLTRQPVEGVPMTRGGTIPNGVKIGLALQLVIGVALVWMVVRSSRRWWKNRSGMIASLPKAQFGIWLGLIFMAIFLFVGSMPLPALILLLLMQFFPVCQKSRPSVKP
jgi:hypothetical protein